MDDKFSRHKFLKFLVFYLVIFIAIGILFEFVLERGDIVELQYWQITPDIRGKISFYSGIYTFLIFSLIAFSIILFYDIISYLISFRVGREIWLFLIILFLDFFGFYLAMYLQNKILEAEYLLNKTGEVVISALYTILPFIGIIAVLFFNFLLKQYSDKLEEKKYESQNSEKIKSYSKFTDTIRKKVHDDL